MKFDFGNKVATPNLFIVNFILVIAPIPKGIAPGHLLLIILLLTFDPYPK